MVSAWAAGWFSETLTDPRDANTWTEVDWIHLCAVTEILPDSTIGPRAIGGQRFALPRVEGR